MNNDQQLYTSVVRRFYFFGFLTGMHFFSGVLVPFFTEWGGVSLFVAQGLQSFFTFCIFALEVPTGTIADGVGRKYSVALGCLAAVIAALIYGSYPHLVIFAVGELFFALAVALISGADKALIYDTLVQTGKEDQATKVFGKARSMHLLGIMLGAPIGSFLAHNLGLNAPMLFTAIPSFLAFVLALSIPEPSVRSAQKEKLRMVTIAKEGWNVFSKDRSLQKLTLNATMVASGAYFVIWLYQPLMMQLQIDVAWFGWFHALLVIFEILVLANMDRLVKLFGSAQRYLVVSALATTTGLWIAGIWPNYLSLCLLLALSGGFGLTRIELVHVLFNNGISSGRRATILSFESMFRRVALVFLNPLIGMITDTSLSVSLLVVGFLPLLTFFVALEEKCSVPAKEI